MSSLDKQRGPITLAAALAERDQLFDRPPRPMSLSLRWLLDQIAQQHAARQPGGSSAPWQSGSGAARQV